MQMDRLIFTFFIITAFFSCDKASDSYNRIHSNRMNSISMAISATSSAVVGINVVTIDLSLSNYNKFWSNFFPYSNANFFFSS